MCGSDFKPALQRKNSGSSIWLHVPLPFPLTLAHRPTKARQQRNVNMSLAFFMFYLEVGMANWMNNLFGIVGGLCVRACLVVCTDGVEKRPFTQVLKKKSICYLTQMRERDRDRDVLLEQREQPTWTRHDLTLDKKIKSMAHWLKTSSWKSRGSIDFIG